MRRRASGMNTVPVRREMLLLDSRQGPIRVEWGGESRVHSRVVAAASCIFRHLRQHQEVF
jgi:hypothetical protein